MLLPAILTFLAPLGSTISVPLDYSAPGRGRCHIYYELGAPWDPRKPVVFLVSDGQQFFVRKGRVAEFQRAHGFDFNVVGIVGRAESADLTKAIRDSKGGTDWLKAWRYLNSAQWIGDIETVRRRLVGPKGKIMLFGGSGGAMMAHEYLAKYGEHVSRAFTQAAVMPWIEAELGLTVPSFWDQIGAIDPSLQADVRKILADHPKDRADIATTFQRQHFFVPADKLAEERASLIRALAAGDRERYAKAKKEYQVDGVRELERSDVGIRIAVREYEFLAAGGRISPPPVEKLDAEYEAEYDLALPLIQLRRAGKIPVPTIGLERLHRVRAEVLVLAARYDEAVDYRSSISLAARYPQGRILILDDNHVFTRAAKLRDQLVRAFFGFGFGSRQFESVMTSLSGLRWKSGAG